MKRKLIYAALLTGILLIGFAIGFLVSGRMIKSRVDHLRSYYTTNGFNNQLMRVINPTPEQSDEIEPILEKYAKMNHDLLMDFKEEQHDLFLELKDELEPLLNDTQIERLQNLPRERFLKNQRESMPERKHRNSARRHRQYRQTEQ